MSSSNVLSDESTVSHLDRLLFKLESAFNLVAGLVVFALVALAVVHVLSRKFLNAPVPGFVDWVEQSMAVFAFLGVAYCQRVGGHIRMDIVVGALRGRALWLAETLSCIFMALITMALIYGSYFHFARSFDWNAPLFSRDSSIDIALPLWPAKFLVPLALSILLIRLILQIWGFGRAFALNLEHPPAVPLIEDAMSQANSEAKTVSN